MMYPDEGMEEREFEEKMERMSDKEVRRWARRQPPPGTLLPQQPSCSPGSPTCCPGLMLRNHKRTSAKPRLW